MSISMKVPQMETIDKTAEIFGLPKYFIRQKAINGEIVAVKAGRKYLINVEKFAEYLNTAKSPVSEPDRSEPTGCIKPIAVNLR